MYSHQANKLKTQARNLERQADELLAKNQGFDTVEQYKLHQESWTRAQYKGTRTQFTNMDYGNHQDPKLLQEAAQLLTQSAQEQIQMAQTGFKPEGSKSQNMDPQIKKQETQPKKAKTSFKDKTSALIKAAQSSKQVPNNHMTGSELRVRKATV